jgi:hypothetical protein
MEEIQGINKSALNGGEKDVNFQDTEYAIDDKSENVTARRSGSIWTIIGCVSVQNLGDGDDIQKP